MHYFENAIFKQLINSGLFFVRLLFSYHRVTSSLFPNVLSNSIYIELSIELFPVLLFIDRHFPYLMNHVALITLPDSYWQQIA